MFFIGLVYPTDFQHGKQMGEQSAKIYRFLPILHFPFYRSKGHIPFCIGGGRVFRQQPHISTRDPFGAAKLYMGSLYI